MSPYFLDGLFTLKDIDGVTDIRGYGMMGGIDLRMDERPGKAGYNCFKSWRKATRCRRILNSRITIHSSKIQA